MVRSLLPDLAFLIGLPLSTVRLPAQVTDETWEPWDEYQGYDKVSTTLGGYIFSACTVPSFLVERISVYGNVPDHKQFKIETLASW